MFLRFCLIFISVTFGTCCTVQSFADKEGVLGDRELVEAVDISEVLTGVREVENVHELKMLTELLVDLGKVRFDNAPQKIRQAGVLSVSDIPYTDANPVKKSHLLDVYFQNGAQNLPVVVYIHGGAWVAGDKFEAAFKPLLFVNNGYVFVSINYPLLPRDNCMDVIAGVAQAISWISDNIQGYGGDSSNIHLIGHSAGAHLAALIGLDHKFLREDGVQIDSVKSVTALDLTVIDLEKYVEEVDFARFSLGGCSSSLETLSPIEAVDPSTKTPNFYFAIAEDRDPNHQHPEKLIELLKLNKNLVVEHWTVPDTDHGSIDMKLGQGNYLLENKLLEFLSRSNGN